MKLKKRTWVYISIFLSVAVLSSWSGYRYWKYQQLIDLRWKNFDCCWGSLGGNLEQAVKDNVYLSEYPKYEWDGYFKPVQQRCLEHFRQHQFDDQMPPLALGARLARLNNCPECESNGIYTMTIQYFEDGLQVKGYVLECDDPSFSSEISLPPGVLTSMMKQDGLDADDFSENWEERLRSTILVGTNSPLVFLHDVLSVPENIQKRVDFDGAFYCHGILDDPFRRKLRVRLQLVDDTYTDPVPVWVNPIYLREDWASQANYDSTEDYPHESVPEGKSPE